MLCRKRVGLIASRLSQQEAAPCVLSGRPSEELCGEGGNSVRMPLIEEHDRDRCERERQESLAHGEG
jgi:hypothetical protein